MLEVYHEVRNRFGPPEEFKIPRGSSGATAETHTHRFHDISIAFYLVNVGGTRAEDIVLRCAGDFMRNSPRGSLQENEIFGTPIPQLAPGQVLHLFRLDDHDLYKYPLEGGRPTGMKDETFTIVATYNAPNRGLNRFGRTWQSLVGGKQYKDEYTFNPKVVRTDLPPAEYVA